MLLTAQQLHLFSVAHKLARPSNAFIKTVPGHLISQHQGGLQIGIFVIPVLILRREIRSKGPDQGPPITPE